MAKPSIAPYGKTEHENAIARGKQMQASPTAVLRARFNPDSECLLLDLQNGARVELPVKDIRELRDYSASQLGDVEVSPGRDGLLWRAIDVGISAPGLLTDFFGSAVRAHLGGIGGRRSTKVKSIAARANGLKGGRPRVKARGD